MGVEHCRIVPHFTASNDLDLYDMPWSHSLALAVVWSCLCGALASWLRPSWGARARVFAVIALAVLSHWIADFVVHASDLPLAPGATTRVGLGLWRFLLLPPVAVITFFVPTPPSPAAMALSGLATYALYAFIPYWAEKPRVD